MSKKDIEIILDNGLEMDTQTQAAYDAIDILSSRRPATTPLIYQIFKSKVDADNKRKGVKEMLNQLPTGDMRDVLVKRYLENLSWEQVADACHISDSYTYKLHQQGLESLASSTKS
ncbi:MAG: DUF1492 domain-containing protein [Defluviitaleaceae bacterium]|nr:DUF1492 domain-containing protein [Defluviitaleaceae bacterium]